jgi:hypothetical protein
MRYPANEPKGKKMTDTGTVWAFDLGKVSIGETVRQGGKYFHRDSSL